ncbi:MAG: hypothetical protein WBE48_10240 [Xanthobacteraceae bacterium]
MRDFDERFFREEDRKEKWPRESAASISATATRAAGSSASTAIPAWARSATKGRRKDMMLKTLLEETGSASLHEYLRRHHK